MTRFSTVTLLLIVSFLTACSAPGSPRANALAPPASGVSGIEDIFVVRSLRQARAEPGEFCAAAKTGFAAKIEDHYVFKAVITREPDGKVVDVRSHEVVRCMPALTPLPARSMRTSTRKGSLRGCP